MSRFDDCDDEAFPNQGALYQANIDRALAGKRGRAFLREMKEALLALPSKRLIVGRICEGGEVCAIGALALKRKVEAGLAVEAALKWLEDEAPMEGFADETGHFAKKHFGVMEILSIQMAYVNDEHGPGGQTPEERYATVLAWVEKELAGKVG